MALCTVEGLVLRTRNLGEADRVITLITSEMGKLQAVARGARRVRNRLLAVAQPFAYGKYQLFLNNHSLHSVSQGELLQSFRRLREDLTCLAYASYLAELTDACLPEEEPQSGVYETVLTAFGLLEQGVVPVGLTARWYEMHLLDLMGFRPELEECVVCRRPIAPETLGADLGFSITGGGVLCPQCARRDTIAAQLGAAAWQTLRFLLGAPAEHLHSFHPGQESLTITERLVTSYIEYRLERRLNALEFLQSLQGADVQ